MFGSTLRARWPALIIALIAGVVSVTAFAPFGAFWLLPIVLAVLFRLADGLPGRPAALTGLVFGLGQFSAGTYWILVALSGVGGAPLPLAVALLVGLIVLLSAFIALTMGLAGRLAPTPGALRYLLWLPALWTLVEWLRSWLFSGFPWLSIGYSQIDSPLVGLAPIFGVFGISWAVAVSAGLIAWASIQWRYAAIAIAALVVVWAGAFGLSRIHWTHPVGEPLSVALVQGDVAQRAKWSEHAVRQAIHRYSELTQGHWHADLVLWPETAIPDYYRAVKPRLDEINRELAPQGTTLITGLLSTDASGQHIYNTAVAVGAGNGMYNKRHLVPFGEYFPVPEAVRHWMAESGMPYADLTPGRANPEPIHANGTALGVSICYEDIFGDLLAGDAPPANILVNISDDAWFGRSIGPDQHFEIARMRAVEVGRYLLRADNSAVTGIVAPNGQVEKRAEDFKRTVVTGRVRPYVGRTPYSFWQSWAVVALAALTLLIGFGTGRPGRR